MQSLESGLDEARRQVATCEQSFARQADDVRATEGAIQVDRQRLARAVGSDAVLARTFEHLETCDGLPPRVHRRTGAQGVTALGPARSRAHSSKCPIGTANRRSPTATTRSP